MTAKKFRVAICGGGIGGLTCAIALSKYPDIEVDIYESAARFTELGAGVGIWPRPWKIMEALGLAHDLLETTQVKPRPGPVPIFNYRKSDQPEGLSFYTLQTNGVLLPFHRPDFQHVLLKHLPPSIHTHCSKRLRTYRQHPTSEIEILFEDGSTALCDLLIGADGIKSAVRRTLLQDIAHRAKSKGKAKEADAILSCVNPVWCGTIAYRALIPGDKLRAYAPNHRIFTSPMQYLGKNAHITAYPISHGKMINVAAFTCRPDLENTRYNGPWVSDAYKDEFLGAFVGWEPEVQTLLQCIDKASKWAIHTVRPLQTFIGSRVVLIGDAAHGGQPTQGSGAGQSIEDAYLLATLLGHRLTTLSTLPRSLSIYDTLRRPFANEVSARSRRNAQFFSLHLHGTRFDPGPGLMGKLQELAGAFTKNWEWAWLTTLDGVLREAVQRLESA